MVTAEAAQDATEIDVDGIFDETTGVRYIGKAVRTFEDRWVCLAVVGGALCRVEVSVRPTVRVDADPGDEDDAGARRARLDRDLAYTRRRG